MELGLTTRHMLLAAGLIVSQQVQAQTDSIVWAVVDWPPYMILRDGKAPQTATELGAGAMDRQLAEIIKRMPDYQHSFRLLNNQRLWTGMQRGQNLCYTIAIPTPERLAFATFTPAFIGPPVAMVVHRKYKESIVGNASMVSLAKALQEHGAEGRLQEHRSYGAQIDAVIAANPNAIKRELVPTTGALLRPLSTGLFAFTLEYPMSVEYARRTGELSMPVDAVPISEAPDWVPGYVACTRNDWGKKVIADIDVAIRKAAQNPPYIEAFGNWMPKEFAVKYAERMRSFYEARSKGGRAIE